MQDIDIGQMSEALNDKADRDLLNTSPVINDYVVETQLPTSSNNYTWYRKYRSGWVEQGGRLAGGSGSYTGTVNLPKEMADIYYSISMMPLTGSGAVYVSVQGTITTASFNYSASDSPNNGFCWEVKGKGA